MFSLLKKYWYSYGGGKAFFTSPFVFLAIIVTFLSQDFWLGEEWLDIPIGMLPNLLGFNLASYSIWLAFGNHKLNKILSKPKGKDIPSRYMEVNASFIHFILIQVPCLGFSVLAKTINLNIYFYSSNFSCIHLYMIYFDYSKVVLSGFIFFLFIYSLFCMFAAILGFIGIAAGLDVIYRKEYSHEKEDKQKNIQQETTTLDRIEKLEQAIEKAEIEKEKTNLELENLKVAVTHKNKKYKFLLCTRQK